MIKLGGIAAGLFDTLGGVPPQWGGISPHLLCRLTAWDMKTEKEAEGSPAIVCPITDANFELSLNWQSPFEHASPETKAPTLMALLQSGQVGAITNALGTILPKDSTAAQVNDDVHAAAIDLMGRTGITKLNSRQVFSGMPPIKLSMTLHFRAISNAGKEVMQPYSQLLKWALPKKLSKDSVLANVIRESPKGVAAMISQMFPSEAPQLVQFVYGNNRYAPMVIEHMSNPISDHSGIMGIPIYRSVQISLSTLTALDADDVANILKKGSFL